MTIQLPERCDAPLPQRNRLPAPPACSAVGCRGAAEPGGLCVDHLAALDAATRVALVAAVVAGDTRAARRLLRVAVSELVTYGDGRTR